MAFYQLLAGTKREFSGLYQAFLRQALFLRLLLYLGMWPYATRSHARVWSHAGVLIKLLYTVSSAVPNSIWKFVLMLIYFICCIRD